MSSSKKEIRNLVIDALMIAVFVVLSRFLTIPVGNVKITIAALPIIFTAFYLGIRHTVIVATLAEFLTQLLGYGLTPTTPLWMLPGILRGIIICILVSFLLKKKGKTVQSISYFEYGIIILTTGIVVLLLNTAVIALDAIIYNYFSYAYVFGDFIFRFIAMIISSVIYMFITKAVIDSLFKAKF